MHTASIQSARNAAQAFLVQAREWRNTTPTIQPEHLTTWSWAWIQHMQAITQRILETPTTDGADLVETLEYLGESFAVLWSPIRHRHALFNWPEWEKPYLQAIGQLDTACTEQLLNQALYQRIRAATVSPAHAHHALYMRRIKKWQEERERNGVHLPETKRKHLVQLRQELTHWQHTFEHHIVACQDSWHVHVEDAEELAGLPQHIVQYAMQQAQKKGKTGYILDLSPPCYSAILSHAHNRDLREKTYHAYQTIGSEMYPEWDNTQLAHDILSNRYRIACMLGFPRTAEWLLCDRMLQRTEEVSEFLHALKARVLPVARQQWHALCEFATQHAIQEPLEMWDVSWVQTQMENHLFGWDSETLRPYFPFEKVLFGLFECTANILGIQCEVRPTAQSPIPLWDPSVKVLHLTDTATGESLGDVLMDCFARPGKRPGAWMDECQSALAFQDYTQRPIAFLTTNFAPSVAPEQSAYLTHEDILVLFHEMGHCLHHISTRVPLPSLSGIQGVEWDAVELPSQLLECFAWEPERLIRMSAHQKDGSPLPEKYAQGIADQRHFMYALRLIRQIDCSLFDLRIHCEHQPEHAASHILETWRAVVNETGIFPYPEFVRFPFQFAHIFAGGYAAGYYSYLWSEVLSTDAYRSMVNEPAAGKRFVDCFLTQGATQSAEQLLVAFQGSPPDLQAFLTYHKLDSVADAQNS